MCLFLATALFATAQNVGINDDNSTPDANAMLDVQSTTKGALFPRMTTAQRTTLGNLNPTEGMLVFDTDIASYFYFVDGEWAQLSTGGGGTVPVGTVLAYAGHIVDDGSVIEPVDGYLLCNGAVIDTDANPEFTALEDVIESFWGNANNDGLNETNNLPDLRGMFLRGDNGARSDGRQDPDKNSRTSMKTGGNTGSTPINVGSYQGDAFENHTHTYNTRLTYINRGSSGGQAAVRYQDQTATTSGASNGPSSETRPRNAYVHYIIKY